MREKMVVAGLLAVSLGVYVTTAYDIVFHARTWIDEVTYIVKSWNYVTGRVAPYSAEDPTWYMPIYFYELGVWQVFAGRGLIESRIFNAGLGLLSGLLVFVVTRRITGNLIASAIGTAVFFTVPAVTFYFATATPIATVSFFFLMSLWLAVSGLGRNSLVNTFTLGLVFGVLYFIRQNMILVIVALAPLYIVGLRGSRLVHSLVLLLGICSVATPLLLIFPEGLMSYAVRLPLVTPLLSELNLFNDPLLDIQSSTTGNVGLGLALGNISIPDILDAFLLPYAGLTFAALTVFVSARKSLRILMIAPIVFLFLVVTHYVGSLDYCQTCILPYTASFAGIGALCAGLAAALVMHVSRTQWLPDTALTLLFMVVVISLNQAASGLATRVEYRFYPAAQLAEARPISEREETEQLAAFLRNNTDPEKEILPIHDLVTVPYALFLADRSFPVQGLNLRHSYRRFAPDLSDTERDRMLTVLADQGLWTDEILESWIESDIDVIVFQVDPRDRDSLLETRIAQTFTRTASTGFRGWNVHIYQRNEDSQDPNNVGEQR